MKRKKKRDEQAQPEEAIRDDAVEAVESGGQGASAPDPAEEWREKYLRTLAELDNYRKRQERDRDQLRRYATEGLLRDVLPVLDALHYACCADGDATAIRDGVKIALNDANRILGEKGLTAIEAMDQPFDPRLHEAVGMQPAGEKPPGMVVFEERRGYVLHDRVLRPSRVHISMAPPPVAAPEAPPEGAADAGDEATEEEDG